MTYSEFTHKVRQRIDEVGINETVSLNFPIDTFVIESINQALLEAPISIASNIIDFSYIPITQCNNGSGTLKLPKDFLRLIEFRMHGWQRSVFIPYAPNDKIVLKQQINATKAGAYRPVVIIHADTLTYYSVAKNKEHIVEIARAQVAVKSISDLPDMLSDATAWLTASKVLHVMTENALSERAMQQYIHIISTLKSQ